VAACSSRLRWREQWSCAYDLKRWQLNLLQWRARGSSLVARRDELVFSGGAMASWLATGCDRAGAPWQYVPLVLRPLRFDGLPHPGIQPPLWIYSHHFMLACGGVDRA